MRNFFILLAQLDPHFVRKSVNTFELRFPGFRSQEFHEALRILNKLGCVKVENEMYYRGSHMTVVTVRCDLSDMDDAALAKHFVIRR